MHEAMREAAGIADTRMGESRRRECREGKREGSEAEQSGHF